MGRRGPRPTPTAVLARRGSWRAKARRGEPKPADALGRPPDWLAPDARRIWRTIARRLEGLDLLTRVDRDVFARYCDLLAQWRRLQIVINKSPPVYALRNEDGSIRYIQERPEVSIYHRLSKLLLQLEREFGFTPSARAGLANRKEEGLGEVGAQGPQFKIV